jgi:hypothetical protein
MSHHCATPPCRWHGATRTTSQQFTDLYLQRAIGPPFFRLDDLNGLPAVRQLRRLPPKRLAARLEGVVLYRSLAALDIQLARLTAESDESRQALCRAARHWRR